MKAAKVAFSANSGMLKSCSSDSRRASRWQLSSSACRVSWPLPWSRQLAAAVAFEQCQGEEVAFEQRPNAFAEQMQLGEFLADRLGCGKVA